MFNHIPYKAINKKVQLKSKTSLLYLPMKFPYYDHVTKKEYQCENEYEFKIKSFIQAKEYNFFDDEVIAYALSIKDELINELDKNSSKSNKIKVEHIRWIEKYLDGIHDFLIQQKMKIPTTLEKHNPFTYPAGNRKGGRPKGSRNKLTDKKYNWVRDRYYILKRKKTANTIKEHSKLIRSELKTNAPEWWGKDLYALETIMDIIKKQKWGD